MRVTSILIVGTALVAGVSAAVAPPAGAHTPKPAPPPTVTILSTAVEVPSNLEVRKGKVLVADSSVDGRIGKVNADGTVTSLIAPARGVSGLALARNGKYLADTYLIGPARQRKPSPAGSSSTVPAASRRRQTRSPTRRRTILTTGSPTASPTRASASSNN